MVKPMLILHGIPHLEPEGEYPLRGRNGQALLGYLAIHHDRWHSREQLADLLWPETDGDRAAHSLRHTQLEAMWTRDRALIQLP